MTTSSPYIPILALACFTIFERSLMYTLKSVVLVTAPWGNPAFVCLYFENVSPYLTLVHFWSKNLEIHASVFPSMLMFLSSSISLALHMESQAPMKSTKTARTLPVG